MKLKDAIKDVIIKSNSILVEAYTEISEELKKLKKVYEDELAEEKIKLIEKICKGENLVEKDIKNKYLTEKEIKKIKIQPDSPDLANDELLDTITIEGKIYYYEQKEKGIIYDSNSKSVGIYKNGLFNIN